MQSDQGFHCPPKESVDTTEGMESKGPDDTLRMRQDDLNQCILHMFENTFPLEAAHMIFLHHNLFITLLLGSIA